MKIFTDIPLEQIEKYAKLSGKELNAVKEVLAYEATKICRGEEEIEDALQELGTHCLKIIADPMYQYVCPADITFEAVPHLAFSGRIYRSKFHNPFEDHTKP